MISDHARKLADEAKAKGFWIYSPAYNRWYSPEEFLHIFNYADAEEVFLKQLQIRSPLDGVNAGFLRLAALQNKLTIFTQRVLEYYKK